MKVPSRKFWRSILFASVFVLAAILFVFARSEKVESDVFSLLREGEVPSDDSAAMRLLLERQGRLLFLRLDGEGAREAAERAAADLVESGAAAGACVPSPKALEKAGRAVFENREILLFPHWLAERRAEFGAAGTEANFEEWLAARAADNLDDFLQKPESAGLAGIVPRDPLLLSTAFLNVLPKGFSDGGAVVLAEIPASATDSAVQARVLERIALLKDTFAKEGVTLRATGAVFFAERSERLIRRDVTRLNLFMTAALLALLAAFLRSTRTILVVGLPLAMGALAAAAALFLFYDSIFALALGIGGILGGIAVDYPLHVLLHKKSGENGFLPAARQLVRPLLLGSATTVLAFVFLLFSDLALLRQAGFLVGVGLAAVVLFVIPCFESFAPGGSPEALTARLETLKLPTGRGWRRGLIGILLLLCAGMPFLKLGDDIAALQPPMPDLEAESALVRAGAGQESPPAVTFGRNLAEAIDRAPRSRDDLTSPLSTSGEAVAAASWVRDCGDAFRAAFLAELEARGYDAGAFAPVLAGFPGPESAASAHLTALRSLAAGLPPGLSWMMTENPEGAWIVTAQARTPGGEHTRTIDARARIGEAFRQYRYDAVKLTGAGFVAASLVILAALGLWCGMRAVAIPLLSSGAALGLLALTGEGFGLFNAVGLLLGYALSMDYAVFTLAPGTGRASVRLSAMTTLCAFAILATSSIPAVRGLGLTVFFIVLFSLLQCEFHPIDTSDANGSSR